jgi:hypothetical protein
LWLRPLCRRRLRLALRLPILLSLHRSSLDQRRGQKHNQDSRD